ncbi:STAS domain-containing protein [Streptomyces sp. NPDC015171]|uniref:STAS domain-containing protein n=1 Tax=Streptomyces sp. NPDC015171 TaxID=3364945 RepID=UPI0036FEB78A
MKDLPSVETTGSGPCLVAKVAGTMDYVTQLELRGRPAQVIDRAERAIVLDLAGVSFCDSAALNVLLGARREAERQQWFWSWPASRTTFAESWR